MRVALVASLVAPIRTAEANGPHAVILDLSRSLSAQGHEVTIYAARGSTVADAAALREIDVDPVVQLAAFKSGRQPQGLLAAQSALAEGFERLFDAVRTDRPDAVSQHAFDAPAIRMAEDLPVLHTLHLPPFDEVVVDVARSTGRPVAAVSEFGRRQWLDAGVPDVLLLRNGVPEPTNVGAPQAMRLVALIAGRISPEKGTHVAIRVARRAGMEPIVVGDIYDDAYFEQDVRPLLRPGELLEALPRAQLWRLMAESCVVLMPIAWDEPFGLVAAEAQMCGCPVVGYRRGALPEVVVDGLGGFLVDPDDEDALVEAATRAQTLDRELISAWAGANLGLDRMVDDYERALREVASEIPMPPRDALAVPGTEGVR